MDNKYQDLHIDNYKTHGTSHLRKIKIQQIILNEENIEILFKQDNSEKLFKLTILKKYQSITID